MDPLHPSFAAIHRANLADLAAARQAEHRGPLRPPIQMAKLYCRDCGQRKPQSEETPARPGVCRECYERRRLEAERLREGECR